jgi:hypothetical protein
MKWAAMVMAALALQAAVRAGETQNAESRTQNSTAATEKNETGARADKPAAPAAPTPADPEAAKKAREEAVRQALERARTRQRLETRAAAPLEFNATPLAQVLEMLGQAGGFSIVFDREALAAAGIDPETHSVTARLTGMTFDDTLTLVLPPACGYQVGAGYIVVTTLEKSWLPLRTMVFSVRELLAEVPDFGGQAPRFEIGGVTNQAAGGTGGGLFAAPGDKGEDETRATPERIVDLVKRHVRNSSDRRIAPWSDEGGPATIEYLDGKLIVSQTYQGLLAVAKLLAAIQ